MMSRAFAALVVLLAALPAAGEIRNIRRFLDQCPQNDPAFEQIRSDFQLRRAGALVTSIPACSEPVSAMPTASYTDELIALQALRVVYYMDRGMAGHLPWTPGTLYDWMKSKVGGIDIVAGGTSFCCEIFGYTPPPPPPPGTPLPPEPPPIPPSAIYIAIAAEDDFNREFDKGWTGISGNIDLMAHEVRHIDGFPHTSCCGIAGGCDQVFDTANLSPYGLQWWLDRAWLQGTINVGMNCLPPIELHAATTWFSLGVNEQFASRFCEHSPEQVAIPAVVGGRCLDAPRRRAVRPF